MSLIELAAIAIVVLAAVAALGGCLWSLVRVNLRLADQSRDQLAMIGALSGNPRAAALGESMVSIDREVPRGVDEMRMRMAGS